MSVFARRMSYAEAVEGRRRVGRRIAFFLLFFLCFEAVSSLFITAYRSGSSSMAPTIEEDEYLLATPLAYGPRTIFGKLPWSSAPSRGDIVVADPPYARGDGFWGGMAESLLRFVSFQRLSIHRGDDPTLAGPRILRVIALPGDRVMMEDFVYKVLPAGSEHYLTEFELSPQRYDISRSAPPAGWTEGLPGSGSMESRLLGPKEYFVDGDSRGALGGSRLWGPIGKEQFLGKVLLRYWPFKRFGAP